MKSQRINGKGKEVQTPPFPTSLAEEWEHAQRVQHSHWPHPSCNDDDCTTTVSTVVEPRRVSEWAGGQDYSGDHRPEDYDKYLAKVAHFSIGDYVVYKWHKENDPYTTLASIRCVLFKMPKEEMTWPRGQGFPKAWVVLNAASSTVQRRPEDAWVTYEHLADHRLLTVEEYDKHIKDNVQLPDYIQQVKDAIKARTCTVHG